LALKLDGALVVLDNDGASGEPQAGTAAFGLGGKEGLKYFGLDFFAHAGAGVGDGDFDITSRRDIRNLFILDGSRIELDHKPAALGHGVARIDGEVDQDLFNLIAIGFDRDGLRAKLNLNADVFAEERTNQVLEFGDNVVEIEKFGLENLLAAKREQLTYESAGACGGF